jgi:hypothetical protein
VAAEASEVPEEHEEHQPEEHEVERTRARASGGASELYEALVMSPAGAVTEGPVPARATVLTLQDQAQLTGGYSWVEHRLFELLGAWVSGESSPQARLLFDVHSQQHAWHARLFAERLPVLDGMDPASLTVVPSAGLERVMALVGRAGSTLSRLVGEGRFLLPRLVSGYTFHLARVAALADAPLIRALRLVLRDEVEAWQATEAMVQSLLVGPDEVRAAAEHLCSLEEELAGTGPGLVPWPLPRRT